MYPSVWRRRDASNLGHLPTNHAEFTLVTPPVGEPVPLHLLRQHVRVSFPDADELLMAYLSAARDRLERYLRRSLLTQTWDLTLDWGPAWLELPKPPLQAIVGVYTTGLDNTETAVDPTVYIVNLAHNLLGLNIGQVWPLHRGKAGFRVRFTTGYGDASTAVPYEVRRQLLTMVALYYDNRTTLDQPDLPTSVQAALAPYRVLGDVPRMARGSCREDLLA